MESTESTAALKSVESLRGIALTFGWWGVLIRLEELVPEEAWEALEVARLRRAVDDDSYREEVLRAKGIVSACSLSDLPDNSKCRNWQESQSLLSAQDSTIFFNLCWPISQQDIAWSMSVVAECCGSMHVASWCDT